MFRLFRLNRQTNPGALRQFPDREFIPHVPWVGVARWSDDFFSGACFYGRSILNPTVGVQRPDRTGQTRDGTFPVPTSVDAICHRTQIAGVLELLGSDPGDLGSTKLLLECGLFPYLGGFTVKSHGFPPPSPPPPPSSVYIRHHPITSTSIYIYLSTHPLPLQT